VQVLAKKITGKSGERPKKIRKISPFRNVTELKNEIISFMNIHKTSFSNHASRISDYFEMCCFNYIVRFYTERNYEVTVQNLQDNKYRYKCSTQGNQENFSHFKVKREKGEITHEFEIHHNLAIQSSHHSDIFTTPDISVIQKESIEINEEFYAGSKKLSFAANQNLVTFCEVKQFTPFPELMFNFIGTVNELRPTHLDGTYISFDTLHLAPSLMISGKPNDHAIRIKKSLEGRYCVNIIYDLFTSTWHPFNKKNIRNLKTIRPSKTADFSINFEFSEDVEF
jgi:hypothetical protein